MDKKVILDKLLNYFLKEGENDIPASLDEKRKLWKEVVLSNDSKKVPEDILALEDKFLRLELLNCKLTDASKLQPISETIGAKGADANKICLWNGDITSIYTDVLVHPTKLNFSLNEEIFPIDSMIFLKSGMRLRMKMEELLKECSLETSDILITRAYNLPCDFIIHVFVDDTSSALGDEVLLKMSYSNILECAHHNMAKIVVLPTLGLNKNNDQLSTLVSICEQSIHAFLEKKTSVEKIVICTSSLEEYNSYVNLFLGEDYA